MTFRPVGLRHGEDGFDVDGELTLHGVIGDRIQVFLEIEAVLNPPQPADP